MTENSAGSEPEGLRSRLTDTASDGALPGGIRLRNLVLTRWMAISGQALAVLFVQLVLGFDFPVLACLAMIGASAGLNIVSTMRFSVGKRLSDREAALYLVFDLIQLSALLFLTGGLRNPFSILILAPVAISASSLSGRSTLILVGLALACVSGLGLFSLPLPWSGAEVFDVPPMYEVGVWAALVMGVVFVATYAWGIAFERRAMSAALAATQFVLAREQRLSAVGGLAAAAAHELGTPLGTIALVASDLADRTVDDEDMKEDVSLLLSQVERCRKILRQLSADPHVGDIVYDNLDLGTLLHELADTVADDSPQVRVALLPHENFDDDLELVDEPVLARRPEIIYGLSNILNNAVDFAQSEVVMTADWSGTSLSVEIADDGPGFAAHLIDRLGEPYLTTRASGDITAGQGDHEGLGLGIFISRTLLAHTGGKMSFANRLSGKGAVVRVIWPDGIQEM